MEKFSGPLAQPIAETVARFNSAPGVSGILLVVFTDDFKKLAVVNSSQLPRARQAELLRSVAEQLEPARRILV